MWHICETGEAHARFWWGDLMERDRVEDLGMEGKIILQSMLKK